LFRNCRVLTVDVEDYFHVEAFSDVIQLSQWDHYCCRVEGNTRRLLDLFDECGSHATFFVLGWVAERFPGLVREIVARGHEAACHSYWHRLVYKCTVREFREDTLLAKERVEQAAGTSVYGYRAPNFSITSRSLWALEVLVDTGFVYDSSIFPIKHDIYGLQAAPRFPVRIMTPSGPLIEYPITTFRLGDRYNLPVGGGGYLRMLPFWYTRVGIRRVFEEGLPLIVYVHPWEVDPGQPRIPGRLRSRVRHYTNLSKMYDRLKRLIQQGDFVSFRDSRLADSAVPVACEALRRRNN
jgi:polysaccharide deacetylase family protein (PEP-CTERM system associated)